MIELLKLNLGCGKNHLAGYLNVDKYGEPELKHDLESCPWPWPDSSVGEIMLIHVLEHLGQDTEIYLRIVQEMYRVCHDQAIVRIVVPHPRHNDFLHDPTHVRPVTPEGMSLFSKKKNEQWAREGHANTPLGLYLDVDFELGQVTLVLDAHWLDQLNSGKISQQEALQAAQQYNNVVKEVNMTLTVIKPSAANT